MPYLNDLDCGGFGYDIRSGASGKGLYPKHDIGRIPIFAGKEIVWPSTTIAPVEEEIVYIQAPTALGGFPAGSAGATQLLADQIQEMIQFHQYPVLIQWESAGGVIRVNSRDGWYMLEQAIPDLEEIATGIIPLSVRMIRLTSHNFRRIGTGFDGGPIKNTSFTITPQNWIPLPVGATSMLPAITRTGSEGAFPVALNPATNPVPFVPSATLANLFLGSCRAYDVRGGIGTYPVPTDGTKANTQWVEAKGPYHLFTGDLVLTNTLYLATISPGVSPGIVLYYWDTVAGTPQWRQYATLNYNDSSSNIGTLRHQSLLRVGPEQVEAYVRMSTSTGNICEARLRLRRGDLGGVEAEFNPLTESNVNAQGLSLVLNYAQKIAYNNHRVADVITQGTVDLAPQTDSGFGASVGVAPVNAVVGVLWQSGPNLGQPEATTTALGFGETSGPSQSTIRRYKFFAINNADVANMQAEAESGTLTGGFVSAADAGASGGNVAQLPSGTGAGATDTWGTASIPPPGTWKLFVRMRTVTGTDATAQMQIGLWDSDDSVFVFSTTYAPNQVATTYAGPNGGGWYEVGSGVPTAGKNMRFRATNTATTTDTWDIDEAILVPITAADGSFPFDLSAQYMYDRSTRRTVDE